MRKKAANASSKNVKDRAAKNTESRRDGSSYNRSLIEASIDPLVTISPDGKITDVNAATIEVTGYSAEELIGTRFSDYFTEPEKAEEGYAIVFRKGIVQDYPLEIRHRDGGVTPVLYNASVYRDDSGHVVGVFAAARDITDLKRAESELRKVAGYNRSLLEASLDPLVTITANGTIGDVNEATVHGTGISREKLIGTDFCQYFTDPARARAGYEQVFREGSVRGYELVLQHKSGKTTPVLYNASVYCNAEGEVAGVFAGARDVTDLRKAENKLKQLNAKLEEKVQSRTAELHDANMQLRAEVVERMKAEKDTQKKNEELNAINEELTAAQEELRQMNEELSQSEQNLTQKNEELSSINEELASTQEELQQNNEELLKAELDLRQTSQYLENLINYANAPIIVWNTQLQITRFNHAFERLTGMPADGVIGRSIDILFPEERKTAMMTNIRQALRGEQWESVEIPIQHTSGDIRTVLWNSATLFRPDGKTALSVIAQGQDITLRKRAEEELERKNDDLNAINEELTAAQEELRRKLDELSARERQLRESESELREILAEKDILLAEIHHRVKNNLTALISLLSLEGGQGDTPEAQAFRNDIQNRARSMALIHETLYRTKKYSEVDMGVYLKNLLDQMQASLSTTVPYRINIVSDNVMLDIPRATPCGLIVNEMVTNVFKHAYPASFDCMKERGAPPTIIIALSLSDGEYTLRFSDNGVGLPAGIDITKSQSLGLKLINFLARHQLRATVNIDTSTGTAFSFRFREKIR